MEETDDMVIDADLKTNVNPRKVEKEEKDFKMLHTRTRDQLMEIIRMLSTLVEHDLKMPTIWEEILGNL